MLETLKAFGIIWTAIILAYGSVAIFLIAARRSYWMLKRAFFKIKVRRN